VFVDGDVFVFVSNPTTITAFSFSLFLANYDHEHGCCQITITSFSFALIPSPFLSDHDHGSHPITPTSLALILYPLRITSLVLLHERLGAFFQLLG
jgi:hypothetical protein